MKRRHFLGCLAIILSFFLCMPNAAEAKNRKLTFVNHAPFAIYVVITYQAPDKDWIVHGWWKVNANGRRSLNFNIRSSNIYLFAEGNKRRTSWTGKSNDSRDRSFTVVSEGFKVNHPNIPRGSDRRKLRFNQVDIGDHTNYTYNFYYNR